MDTSNASWFNIASQKMDWLTARQKAISENIANADTPGYIGKDVVSFEDHLSASENSARGDVEVTEANNSWGGSFDGNKVVLEEQVMLSSETTGDFALASRLYRKGYQMIGLAAGRK